MSALAGFHGSGRPEWVDAMLAAVSYRGDAVDVVHAAGASLGARWWAGRPGKAPGVVAGCTFAKSVQVSFPLRLRLAIG